MARSSPKVSIIIKELSAHVEQRMAAFALQVIANLTASPAQGGTPVDTGWARANWIASFGKPLTTTTGSPESVSRGAQQTSIGSLIRYKLGDGPIYITNNVPYIQRLNAGWSKQAPAGFIQSAVARAKAKAARSGRYGR